MGSLTDPTKDGLKDKATWDIFELDNNPSLPVLLAFPTLSCSYADSQVDDKKKRESANKTCIITPQFGDVFHHVFSLSFSSVYMGSSFSLSLLHFDLLCESLSNSMEYQPLVPLIMHVKAHFPQLGVYITFA